MNRAGRAMPVHVSIHDVTPAWTNPVEQALELTREAGVRPALLVVPNYHGAWPLEAFPEFTRRLRELNAAGHEVYLHGFQHESRPRRGNGEGARDGRPAGVAWLVAQRVVSAGEAEFSDLSQREAEQRLSDGERVLRAAGLAIAGFVPPAWSMPRWLVPMLARRGYRFCEDHLRVYDPLRQRSRASVVLNFASRSAPRLLAAVAYCRLAKHAGAVLPARIAIHPADLDVALLRSELRALLRWGRGRWVERGSALLRRA